LTSCYTFSVYESVVDVPTTDVVAAAAVAATTTVVAAIVVSAFSMHACHTFLLYLQARRMFG
jgi:hypothetical protein